MKDKELHGAHMHVDLTQEQREFVVWCYLRDLAQQDGKEMKNRSGGLTYEYMREAEQMWNECMLHLNVACCAIDTLDVYGTNMNNLASIITTVLREIVKKIEGHEMWNEITFDADRERKEFFDSCGIDVNDDVN